MRVTIEKTGQTRTLRYTGTVAGLLRRLKLNPVTVLVVRNGTIVPETAKVKDSDTIEVLSVVSGG